MADLRTNLGKLTLKNPVMTASGTFGYGREYAQFFPLEKLGAVVVKGIAPFPSHGNRMPRTCEVHSGMLNAIGLQGPGLEAFLHDEHYLPYLRTANCTVIVNIWGHTVEDYALVAEALEKHGNGAIAALEINISCPNVKHGGIAFGTDRVLAAEVVHAVREKTTLPLITKLSPTAPDIPRFAQAMEEAGSDMLSLINTLSGMAIDPMTWQFKIANKTGGLSGPAIKPIAVRMVYEAANAVSIPVIGMGGITTAMDAVEFFLAGARAIAVGTAIFSDPYAPIKVIDGLNAYLDERQMKLDDIIGQARAI